jgi:hypothetical protein
VGELVVKTFYSAEDIEALVARGQTELILDEDTVLTQLARDAAQTLGLKLIRGPSAAPASFQPATVRPSTGRETGLDPKPKGCQHGPLVSRPSAAGASSGSSDKVVDELVDLVKQLSKGNES